MKKLRVGGVAARAMVSEHALGVLTAAGLLFGCNLPNAMAAEPISLPDQQAYPENISAASDGTLYVGSFASGGITRMPL